MVTIRKINSEYCKKIQLYCLISQLKTKNKLYSYIICLSCIKFDNGLYLIDQVENYITEMNTNYNIGGTCMLYYLTLLYLNKTIFFILETSSSNIKGLSLYYYYGFQVNNKRLKYYPVKNLNCFLMTNTKMFTHNFTHQQVLISTLK